MKKKILGAALGSCVHVAGLHHFLDLARAEGYETESLGPAVPVDKLLDQVEEKKPDLVAVSYRLTPEAAAALFKEMKEGMTRRGSFSEGLLRPPKPPPGPDFSKRSSATGTRSPKSPPSSGEKRREHGRAAMPLTFSAESGIPILIPCFAIISAGPRSKKPSLERKRSPRPGFWK